MKERNKLLIIGIAVLFLVAGCGKKNETKKPSEDSGNKQAEEVPSSLIQAQIVEGLKIEGLSIAFENGASQLVATVENTTDKDYEVNMIQINLYDADKNLIIETYGYIGKTIAPKGVETMVTTIGRDVTSAKSAEYKLMKKN